jgi:hypothetical protein
MMMAELDQVKRRLGIPEEDTQYDEMLTMFIEATGERFNLECDRVFERTVGYQQEFDGDDMEIALRLYPLESIAKWELSSSQAGGWVEQPGVDVLVRCGVVLSLSSPLGSGQAARARELHGRLCMPGVVAGPGQKSLPKAWRTRALSRSPICSSTKTTLGR